MSYSIDITFDKEITESELDEVLSGLPEWASPKWKGGKQFWGWSLASDVWLSSPRKVVCSGSCSISGDVAEKFSREVAKALRKTGRKVNKGKMRI